MSVCLRTKRAAVHVYRLCIRIYSVRPRPNLAHLDAPTPTPCPFVVRTAVMRAL